MFCEAYIWILDNTRGCRLVSAKHQHAVAGLVMAMSTEWSLDIREHEFDETEALRRAILGSTCLVSLNSLSLKDAQDENISRSLQQDRSRQLRHVTCTAHDAFPLSLQGLFWNIWRRGESGKKCH